MRPLNRLTLNETAFLPPTPTIRSGMFLSLFVAIYAVFVVAVLAIAVASFVAVVSTGERAILLVPATVVYLFAGVGGTGQLLTAAVGAARAFQARGEEPVAGWAGRTICLVDSRRGVALVAAFLNNFGWLPPWRVMLAALLFGCAVAAAAASTYAHWALALIPIPLVGLGVWLVVRQVRWTRRRQRAREIA